MLDIKFVRENTELVKKGVAAKQYDAGVVDEALKLDLKKRTLIKEIEEVRAQRNIAASNKDIAKGREIKEKLQKLEPQLESAEKDFLETFSKLPNLPSDRSPVGKGEKENIEVKKWGEPTKFDFEPSDHLELGKKLGILDFETGAKVAGSQFYFLYGDGARLELALTMYVFDNGDYYDCISLKLVSRERLQKIMDATKSSNAHIFRKYSYTWIRVNSTYIYHIENKSDCNISKSHAWFLERKGLKVDYGKRRGIQRIR